jgi:sugar lactone lactonase YvrE
VCSRIAQTRCAADVRGRLDDAAAEVRSCARGRGGLALRSDRLRIHDRRPRRHRGAGYAAVSAAGGDTGRGKFQPGDFGGRANDRLFLPDRRHAAHIFAIDADGTNLRQVTRGAGETGAALSADGRTLAYYSAGNDMEIWTQSLDGGEPRKLSDRANGNNGLAVSPDGRHVAFLEWQSSVAN